MNYKSLGGLRKRVCMKHLVMLLRAAQKKIAMPLGPSAMIGKLQWKLRKQQFALDMALAADESEVGELLFMTSMLGHLQLHKLIKCLP